MVDYSRKAVLVVTDGLGFNPAKSDECVATIRERLDPRSRSALSEVASRFALPQEGADAELLSKVALMPIAAEAITQESSWRSAQTILQQACMLRGSLRDGGMDGVISSARRDAAAEHRYIPWIAENPKWSAVVNGNFSVPTHASGIWVGYEDIDPPVQGNSETGHQQIGNLALAPQIPLQITQSIDDGSFYSNGSLVSAIRKAVEAGGNVNFCFLLSGMKGSDGRVHSAWNHLEAFCELVFNRMGVSPDRVRMQAILDGRDAPSDGSLRLDGSGEGFLHHLERLLRRFNALESLAWVIGRSIAMDRDYREENARADYLLLTAAEGRRADSMDSVREIVAEIHRQGATDADVPPICVTHSQGEPQVVRRGDAFVNLNFRSDRQRAKTASLCGAVAYLESEAGARGRRWGLEWLRSDLSLELCTIAEYDAVFESEYGVEVSYPIESHRLNFLSLWDDLMPSDARYLLVAESVKASHMGYFVRGRREMPEASDAEERVIVPSVGAEEGVLSDSDFYVEPRMRTAEVVREVTDAMDKGRHSLVMCNLSAPDMIGHLLPSRYGAAIEAYGATVSALERISRSARRNGYSMVVTSDHGNIESDAPTHTINPVLTTIIPASGGDDRVKPRVRRAYSAALFDISPTLAGLLGVDMGRLDDVVAENRGSLDERFIGKSLVCVGD